MKKLLILLALLAGSVAQAQVVPSAQGQLKATHLAFVGIPSPTYAGKLPAFEVVQEDTTGHEVFGFYTVTLSAAQISGTLTRSSAARTPATFTDISLSSTQIITASSPGLTPAKATVTIPTPAAAVVPATYFGMHVNSFQQHFAPVGFATVRSWDATNFYGQGPDWADTNPSRGVYNWAALDQYLLQMQGKDIVYDLGRTPSWASLQPASRSTYGPGQAAPPILNEWETWVKAVATHVGTKITYWEIWNEPNYAETWIGDVPTMVAMARQAYSIIKSINPNAVVLSPAVAGTNGAAWMETFIADGGESTFDVLAFHGYTEPAGIAEGELTLVAYYEPLANGKPLWDTEGGWNSTSLSTAQEQAFLARAYLLQWPAVSRFIWYAYDGTHQWGQMWSSAGQNAVATTYSQVQDWMVGASMSPCIETAGVYTCQLTRAGGYAAEVAWIPEGSATVAVPAGMTQYRDLSGFVHEISSSTVTVGYEPILLEKLASDN
jgi:hypothetical protein